jgi:hypothetical protein
MKQQDKTQQQQPRQQSLQCTIPSKESSFHPCSHPIEEICDVTRQLTLPPYPPPLPLEYVPLERTMSYKHGYGEEIPNYLPTPQEIQKNYQNSLNQKH